ncbi:MAG: DUF4476 domain-containing protein [Myxococcota bacterium]
MFAALSVLALATPALAKPGSASITLHDPFTEQGRFTVRGLALQGEGNVLNLERGGQISGQLDFVHHCPGCGGSINQIIVGVAGEDRAQACIYNGGGQSGGWQRANFTLSIPDAPGVYEIRARYAQAHHCGAAMGWWRVDRPHGPGGESTIGLVFVAGPAPVERTRDDVRRDIDDTLQHLDEVTDTLVKITRKKMPPPRQIQAAQLSGEARDLTRTLMVLQAELRDFGKGGDQGPKHSHVRPRPQIVVHADPLPQHIVVVQAPAHHPPPPPAPVVEAMGDADFQALVKTVKKQAFEETQLNYLRDVMRTNPWFTTGQAVAMMKVFAFSSGQVEAGALMCKRIIEPNAFLRMVELLTWDSDRDALRTRTGGVCGPVNP